MHVCLLLMMLLTELSMGETTLRHLMGLHGLVILMMGLNSLWEMNKMNRFEKQGFLKTHG